MENLATEVLKGLAKVAGEEICLAWGMKDDLEKLEETMSTIKAVLLDAEKKQEENDELRVWLGRLNNVFQDAQDVLGEFECELLRREVVKTHGSISRKVCRFFSRSNPLAFRFRIGHQLKAIRQRLDDVAKDRRNFHLERQGESLLVRGRQEMTSSFVRPSEIIGRDSDKEKIINMLLEKDQNDHISIIPIVGVGGLGKTALAKLVYNDDEVDEEFNLKMWVCVQERFNFTVLIREILKSAIAATQMETGDVENWPLDRLQISLRRTLKDKKFLLVLDNVWNEDRRRWKKVKDLLSEGCRNGSKIIVTTRNTSVALVMGTVPAHALESLSEEDSLSLFLKYAFEDEQSAEQFPKLKEIGKQIVQKCAGVPLALNSLGSLLFSKTDEVEWTSVRDNPIWESERGHNDPSMPVLRLSYDAMSPELKQCFAYCSLIPKNFRKDRLYLIWIWMALGIIQSSNDRMELEDIGKLHFKELCCRSFFQYLDDEEKSFSLFQDFEMHDLIHDLATSLIKHEHFTVNSDRKAVPDRNARHLTIFINDSHGKSILPDLKKLKKVRSVVLAYEMDEEPNIDELFLSTCITDEMDEEPNIDELFLSTCISSFGYLRMFDLDGICFGVLPSSIGTLKHLRYLNLSGNKIIKKLPDSICNLQSLQTLLLLRCPEFEELPRDIRNLVRLRTLMITTKQTCFPENGIGRLKSLRHLHIYRCRNLRSLPDDMRFCTTLRTLMMVDCEQLDLVSRSDEVSQLSLQSLIICRLPQMTALPEWLRQAAHALQLMIIGDCPEWAALPEWLPILTSLQKLVISGSPKLSSLPDGMENLTSLTHLGVGRCNALKERCKRETGEDWPKIAHVPNLYISG